MKKNWKLIYKGKISEFDNSQADFWSNKSASEKFMETRNLINQAMSIKGRSLEDASRLLRTTAVLKRQ